MTQQKAIDAAVLPNNSAGGMVVSYRGWASNKGRTPRDERGTSPGHGRPVCDSLESEPNLRRILPPPASTACSSRAGTGSKTWATKNAPATTVARRAGRCLLLLKRGRSSRNTRHTSSAARRTFSFRTELTAERSGGAPLSTEWRTTHTSATNLKIWDHRRTRTA